ncbi:MULTISPECIES: ArnT family glycosyltransferase [Candidatus Cardinium]|uniref:ArnT family glycosyltransferase n=1 Tax=Candidatus Cardinium TaxID=273135 RepID=UPI001FAAB8A1|nr:MULTISPECIES: glycosyltransferase family 39 protein [Cardinium]
MQKDSLLTNSSVAYFLVGFGSIFALGIGGLHLFDLDELYFAEITREMMHTGRYGQVTFGFQPLYEKPPLFFWLQAVSMHFWGVNEIGARFPNLICGLLTLVTLYYIGKRYKGKWFGFLWMCLYATAFLPHFYFKSGIIDPFFNYFLLLAIYLLSTDVTSFKGWIYGGTGLSIGCALLTKGPMAVLIPFATLALSYTWFRRRAFSFKGLIVVMLVAAGLLSCWLIPEIWSNGYTFIKEFWAYHLLLCQQPVHTHAQPWYYHYLVLFGGCFPSSLFAILFLKEKKMIRNNYFAANMQALLASVLLIFTLVGTKIVHYSSMAYFPITFFAADFFYESIYHRNYICSKIATLFLLVGLVLGSALAIIPLMMRYKDLWYSFITNQVIKDALKVLVVWSYWDSMPGIIYIIGISLAYYYLIRDRLVPFIGTFMCVNIGTLTFFLMCIAPKVEAYTQKKMVDFCQACKGKSLYLTTIGFKSAAPLFYADQSKALNKRNIAWLLTGEIDKPCFFILYKSDRELLRDYENITYIKDMGCFALYQRLPKNLYPCNPD